LEHRAEAGAVFDLIKAGKYAAYTSVYATDEMANDVNIIKRDKMLSLIPEYSIKFLSVTEEVKRLANLYVREKAVSAAHWTDAAHIAITSINGLDFIVSFNFTHIARAWTIERVRKVNIREGYAGIGIYKPVEVLSL
jgi:hypothetical protein